MEIISYLHRCVKIEERGDQATGTTKAVIFHQVWHPYIIINAITGEVINIKYVYLSHVSVKRQISCKKITYNTKQCM